MAGTETNTSPKCKLFGEIAVELGLVKQPQVDECLVLQRELAASGVQKSLGAVMHDREYLTLVQMNRIMDEVERSRRRHSIEGYEIISKLGKGGMGAVYLARRLSLNKLVAIKVLPPKLASNKDYLTRFRREAEATAKLNHPNVVQAYDVGESNGYNYFVMEYVEGETIKDILERTGVTDEPRALEIAIQIVDALKHAWAHGIVHRDIKPANIMISKTGQAKLCDLGLAIDVATDHAITRSGVIMGTPYYLSPEQARSEPLDTRSDIYSFGATLFHMLTGVVPFEGDTPAVILTKHLTEAVPDPLARNPVLSRGVCFIVTKMMAKDREARYQDPEELLRDLVELKEQGYLTGKRYAAESELLAAARAARRRRIATTLAVTVLFCGSVGFAAVRLGGDFWRRTWARAREKQREIVAEIQKRAEEGGAEKAKHRAQELASRADRTYEEAERYRAENPRDLDGARDRFADITAKYPGTAAAQSARAQVAAIEAAIDEEAKALYLSIHREARERRDAGRFAEARAALERFPDRYARTRWPAEIEKLRVFIDEAARQRFADGLATARERRAAGDFDGARAVLVPALAFGLDDIKVATEAELAAIEAERAAHEGDAARAAESAVARAFAAAFDAAAARCREDRFEEAAVEADRLARATPDGPPRTAVDALVRDVRALAAARAALEARLRARVGERVRLRIGGVERAGVLVDVRDGKIRLREDIGELVYPLATMDPVSWLGAGDGAAAEGETRKLVGVLRALEGRREEARRELLAARELGAEVDPYLRKIDGAP